VVKREETSSPNTSTVDSSGKQYTVGMPECQIAKRTLSRSMEQPVGLRGSSRKNDPPSNHNSSFSELRTSSLGSLKSLSEGSFDFITLASAFALFPDPKAALKHWTKYLKPGGIITLDVTHPKNLASRNVIERVSSRMRVPIPYYRQWVKSEDSLRELLEGEGLIVLDIVQIDNQRGYGKRYYDVNEEDDVFDKNIDEEAARHLRASIKVQYKANEIFREEWSKAAVDGKVEEVDTVFLGIARKDEQ
jgi:SAM-dependent methyltransferase